jgi:hypothetical protein
VKRTRINRAPRRIFLSEELWQIRTTVTLVLCLGLGSSMMTACTLSPVVVAGTTAAAALAREVEEAVQGVEANRSMTVSGSAVVYAGPGRHYWEIVELKEPLRIEVLSRNGDWIEARSARFHHGWIHVSCVREG